MSEAGDGGTDEAVEMLTHGRGLTFQLRDLFLDDQIPVSGDRLVLAEDLIDKIHESFNDSISALERRHSADEMNKSTDQESGESSRSRRSSSFPNSAAASRRKRREVREGESWIKITSTPVHDGHAWRKYGQKRILNADHSRSYFKCTHKYQFNCPAKKHVQQIGDDPVTYRSVYTFGHTCTVPSNTMFDVPASQMILEPDQSAPQPDMNLASSSSFMLNFQSSQHDNSYTDNALVKQEYTSLNGQQTEDHHLTSVQKFTSSNNSGHSDVGREEPPYMDGIMNCYGDYSPYMTQPQDIEDPWNF